MGALPIRMTESFSWSVCGFQIRFLAILLTSTGYDFVEREEITHWPLFVV
jgi:hypothetical protein